METQLFDFNLPKELIAQVPAARRDSSRLMLVDRKRGTVSHHVFNELPELLPPKSRLFRNNAAVIKARLKAHKPDGGPVECLLLHPGEDALHWWCLLKPGRKLKPGATFGIPEEFESEVIEKQHTGKNYVRFKLCNDHSVLQMSERLGEMPLPPYIRRNKEPSLKKLDDTRYQTVFSNPNKRVAAAAPTAGLHFTPELFKQLRQREIFAYDLTLHVGLDTFQPIKEKFIEQHVIHKEFYEIPSDTLSVLREENAASRVAIGTTSARTMEDYWRKAGRASPARNEMPAGFSAEADLFIYPPETFEATDILLTNFHLPRSTLLCLVAAFLTPGETSGIKWLKEIYTEAVASNYRFFSYGDAMLIL